MVEIRAEDLWNMYLCMVRYSMGRRTYMPSECEMLYMTHHRSFQPEWCRQLAKEIDTELRFFERHKKTLGDECDHEVWVRLRDRALADSEPSA